jgi:pimeloyl-ACP methyl ester carboxylesterase
MKWLAGQQLEIDTGAGIVECRCWGEGPETAATIVLLHEGLGCVDGWKDFPHDLCDATGCGVFAYSRLGYGQSDPVSLPRPLDYMTREALDILPVILDQAGIRKCLLLGHSDGASIAAIYAGTIDDSRVRGLCLMAPHFFTEEEGLASIAEAKAVYETSDLKARLARRHRDPDVAFRGWNDAWLDPGFKSWNIEAVIDGWAVPVLAIQGRDDQYGTSAQLDAMRSRARAPLDVLLLDDCRHNPQFDQPAATLEAVADFVSRLGLNLT